MMASHVAFSPWIGRKIGRLHALVYQFGGSSNSGLPMMPEGAGYLALPCPWRNSDESTYVRDAWHTEPQQTCINKVDFDTNAHAEENPQ